MGRERLLLEASRDGNAFLVCNILSRESRLPFRFSKPVNVNFQDKNGFTALHEASLHGKKDIVGLLLARGADVFIVDQKGCTPLHIASWGGHEAIAAELLRCDGRLVNYQDNTGSTALHYAAQYGYTDCVKTLLRFGESPLLKNNDGLTPGDLAAQYGWLSTVSALVTAYPSLTSNKSQSSSSKHSMLHLASRNGHKDVVTYLLDNGYDINYQTTKGTALHEAALWGKLGTVRLLLERGCNVSICNSSEQTVIEMIKEHHLGKKTLEVLNELESQLGRINSERSFSSGHTSSVSTPKVNLYDSIKLVDTVSKNQDASPEPPVARVMPRPVVFDTTNAEANFNRTSSLLHRYNQGSRRLHSPLSTRSSSASCADRSKTKFKFETFSCSTAIDLNEGNVKHSSAPVVLRQMSVFETPELVSESDVSKRVLNEIGQEACSSSMKQNNTGIESHTIRKDVTQTPREIAQSKFYISPGYTEIKANADAEKSHAKRSPNHQPNSAALPEESFETIFKRYADPHRYEEVWLAAAGKESIDKVSGNLVPCDSVRSAVNLDVNHLYNVQKTDPSKTAASGYAQVKKSEPKVPIASGYAQVKGKVFTDKDQTEHPCKVKQSLVDSNRLENDRSAALASPGYETVFPIRDPQTPEGRVVSFYDNDTSESSHRTVYDNQESAFSDSLTHVSAISSSRPTSGVSDNSVYDNVSKSRPFSMTSSVILEDPLLDASATPPNHRQKPPEQCKSPKTDTCDNIDTDIFNKSSLSDHMTSRALMSQRASSEPNSRDSADAEVFNNEIDSRKRSVRRRISNRGSGEILRHKGLYNGLRRGSIRRSKTEINPRLSLAITSRKSSKDAARLSAPSLACRNYNIRPLSRVSICNDSNNNLSSNTTVNNLTDLTTAGVSVTGNNCCEKQLGTAESRHENHVSVDGASRASDNLDDWEKVEMLMSACSDILTDKDKEVFEQKYVEAVLASDGSAAVGKWLSRLGLECYEKNLIENGFDHLNFLGGGILEMSDLRLIGIHSRKDRRAILKAAAELPVFLPQCDFVMIDRWLESLHLSQYLRAFTKAGYTTIDRLLSLWELELQTVIGINKPGHRKRIIAALSLSDESGVLTDDDIEDILKQASELVEVDNTKPGDVSANSGTDDEDLFKDYSQTETKSHKIDVKKIVRPEILIKGCYNFTVAYMGCCAVSNLEISHGEAATHRAIGLLKSSSDFTKSSRSYVLLSVSYRGVKFLNFYSKDPEDLRNFAYITLDQDTDSFYCHAFTSPSRIRCEEILATLVSAFNVAYNLLNTGVSNQTATCKTAL